ncbi:hypothetical protein [Enterococcus mundtii]|uniref:hypothetical protein n=1 Tax=Enterococcus mundtii TaxID=53346 RepID=UPI003970F483
MKKRMNKQMLIGITIIISLVIIIIGGKVYIDKREERKAQELFAVEKQAVQVLKNTFADITEIKFERSGKNDMTGTYGMFVTMKNKEKKQVSFSFTFSKKHNEIYSYIINDRNIQKKGITKNPIYVIFSNNMEDEI